MSRLALRLAVLVLGIGFTRPAPATFADLPELPAPTRHRLVLHGVALNFQQRTVHSDSSELLEFAIATLTGRGHVQVVIHTLPAPGGTDHASPSSVCGAAIVRSYLNDRGVPLTRMTTVAVPAPQPSALLALASDGSEHCRVGLVVD